MTNVIPFLRGPLHPDGYTPDVEPFEHSGRTTWIVRHWPKAEPELVANKPEPKACRHVFVEVKHAVEVCVGCHRTRREIES